MMRLSARRLAVPIMVWAILLTLGVLAGMEPNPALLAITIGALSLLSWFVADYGQVVGPARWRVETAGSTLAHGEDRRVGLLQRQLDGLFRHSSDALSPILVTLIEERVRSRHGIDRDADADAFRRIVGPELAAFVAATEAGSPVAARSLSDIVSRIERL